MPKKRTPSKKRSLPTREIQLLDRGHLTREVVDPRSWRVDRYDPQDPLMFLTGAAPLNFQMALNLEDSDPWLWVGLGDGETCYAVIGPSKLREIAKAILRYTEGAR